MISLLCIRLPHHVFVKHEQGARLDVAASKGGGPEGIVRAVDGLTWFPSSSMTNTDTSRFDRTATARGPSGALTRVTWCAMPDSPNIRSAPMVGLLTLTGGDREVFGVLALVDPHGKADEQERIPLEQERPTRPWG